MNYTLIVQQGTGPEQRIPIKLAQFLIGRDAQCHLRPLSPLVSKRHCAILLREGKAYIRDFDSTNGTFVNDQPVKGQVELNDGDVLRLGPLVFRWQAQATAPAATVPNPVTPQPVDEDFMAALLLEDTNSPSQDTLRAEAPSDDSTLTELAVPPESPAEKKPAGAARPAPAASGNTSDAAKSLLQRYHRRSRT